MIRLIPLCCMTLYIAVVSQLFSPGEGVDDTAPSLVAEVPTAPDQVDSSSRFVKKDTDLRLDLFCEELPLSYCQTGLALLSDACPAYDSIAIKISTKTESNWIPIQMYCDSPNPGIFYFDHNCEPWRWAVYRYRSGRLLQESTGVVNP